ncbi:hypothetical protein [Winogradskyella sp.]|uniref:hypothetical protein n=1 Tax=Winogradskyella sp. TaxID=1883156 RepID=UPI003BAAA6D7
MDETSKHIDLIDKYLNQTLSQEELEMFNTQLLSDPDFVKEVELYRIIYAGIKKEGEDALKERLGKYAEEYKNEDQHVPQKGKVIKLIMRLSVAATIVLGGYFIFNYYNQGPNAVIDGPKVVETDTVQEKKPKDSIFESSKEVLVEENDTKKEIMPQKPKNNDTFFKDNSQLSIGGVEKLSKERIRKITYPQQLQYTFNGKTLSIFGDPLIAALQLQVLKKPDGAYVLKYKNKYYEIEQKASRSDFIESNKTYSAGIKSDEQINIKIESIVESSIPYSNIEVALKVDNSNISYAFNKDINELTLTGNIDQSKATLFLLDKEGSIYYFLMLGNALYELNANQNSPTSIMQSDILKSKNTRLFRERDAFIKDVFLIN